jgi:hypothetical protein
MQRQTVLPPHVTVEGVLVYPAVRARRVQRGCCRTENFEDGDAGEYEEVGFEALGVEFFLELLWEARGLDFVGCGGGVGDTTIDVGVCNGKCIGKTPEKF